MNIMTNMIKNSTLLLLLLMAPMTLHAKGDAAAGQQKSVVCQACHGTTGESVDPSYPNLAGQYRSYMEQALRDYRSGRRSNAVMAGFAANLSNQDIADLATWYSKQAGLKDLKIK